jgi:hypothetical protein
MRKENSGINIFFIFLFGRFWTIKFCMVGKKFKFRSLLVAEKFTIKVDPVSKSLFIEIVKYREGIKP